MLGGLRQQGCRWIVGLLVLGDGGYFFRRSGFFTFAVEDVEDVQGRELPGPRTSVSGLSGQGSPTTRQEN